MKFGRRRKRPEACGICSQPAISICNYDQHGFKGCDSPFCSDHGVPHHISEMASLLKTTIENNEDQRQTAASFLFLFKELSEKETNEVRVCFTCLDSLIEERKQERLRTQCFIATLITIFFGLCVATAWYLLQAPPRECPAAHLPSIIHFECFKVRTLSIKEHKAWLGFQHPEVLDFEFFGTHPTMEPMPPFPEEEPYKWGYICKCPFFVHSKPFSYQRYEEIERGGCFLEECKPNGRSILTYSGFCWEAEEAGELCPAYSRFNSQRDACIMVARPTNYYIRRGDFKASNCPVYSRPVGKYFCSSDPLVVAAMNFEEVQLRPLQSKKRKEPCESSSTGLALDENTQDKTLRQLAQYGYIATTTNEFGYWQCIKASPAVPTPSRVCEPQEMLVRWQVGCTSPCKPCTERWDYSLRACVAADAFCSDIGTYLISNGECYSARLPEYEEALSDIGIYYC